MIADPTYLRASFIAKASVPLFMAIGIIEVLSGSFSGSVGLVSDGVHTLSDGLVSGIVWIGLRFARRGPDGKFPSDKNCKLVMMGPEDQREDLLDASVAHAIKTHGHADNPELRSQLNQMLESVSL